MAGKTISDWIIEAKRRNKDLEKFHTEKKEDLQRLEEARDALPQFHSITLPYSEFKRSNERLMEFISKYKGFCVRALPNERGKERGFARRNKRGYLSFEECKKFLSEIIQKNKEDYDVGISDWEPSKFGFILISGTRNIYGEIGNDLEALSHGTEEVLASFAIDKAKIGHLENKTTWGIEKNKEAKKYLLKALSYIKAPFDNFNPIFLPGYFEGTILESGDVRFLDYKINKAYLL